jgi:hypothetical protein
MNYIRKYQFEIFATLGFWFIALNSIIPTDASVLLVGGVVSFIVASNGYKNRQRRLNNKK